MGQERKFFPVVSILMLVGGALGFLVTIISNASIMEIVFGSIAGAMFAYILATDCEIFTLLFIGAFMLVLFGCGFLIGLPASPLYCLRIAGIVGSMWAVKIYDLPESGILCGVIACGIGGGGGAVLGALIGGVSFATLAGVSLGASLGLIIGLLGGIMVVPIFIPGFSMSYLVFPIISAVLVIVASFLCPLGTVPSLECMGGAFHISLMIEAGIALARRFLSSWLKEFH